MVQHASHRLACVLLVVLASAACAEDAINEDNDSKHKQINLREMERRAQATKQLRAEALRRAKAVQVALAEDNEEVELIEQPVLRFGDPTRGNEDGSLWVWGKTGRPLVMAEIYHSRSDRARWAHAITQTSTTLVVAETNGGRWAPQKPQLNLTDIDDAPPPSTQKTARLSQLKAIARRYEAHEFWKPNNTRYKLRQLARPVHRYEDPENGLLDGAVFVFANGTNPEILMFVEAHATEGQPSKWSLGFAPLGSAELHVTLDNRDIWKQPRAPRVVGRPSDPYWIFIVSEEKQAID